MSNLEITSINNISNYSISGKINHQNIFINGNFDNLKYGEEITTDALSCKPVENYYNNLISFNLKKYILTKRSLKQCYIDNYIVYDHHFSILTQIRNLRLYLVKQFENIPLVSSLILGVKDEELSQLYASTGVSHLFVISGTHIAIIIIFISNFLSLFIKDYFKHRFFLSTILIFYTFISGFNIPVIRVVAFYLLHEYNQNLPWHKIILIFMCIYNPFITYNYSFLLSYSISYYITNYLQHQQKKHSFIRNNFELFLISLPIQIQFNHSFNLFTPLINSLLIPVFTIFLIPLSLVTSIFPFTIFISLLNFCFILIVKFLEFFSYFQIYIGTYPLLITALYYLLLYCLKNNYSLLYSSIIIFILLINFFNYQFSNQILFIDGPNPNIILIKSHWANILINLGDKNFNQELNKIIKNQQIYSFEYIILNPQSQSSDVKELTKSFPSKHIITNIFSEDINIINNQFRLELNHVNNSIDLFLIRPNIHFFYSQDTIRNYQQNTIYITDDCNKILNSNVISISNSCSTPNLHKNYNPNLSGLLKVKF